MSKVSKRFRQYVDHAGDLNTLFMRGKFHLKNTLRKHHALCYNYGVLRKKSRGNLVCIVKE